MNIFKLFKNNRKESFDWDYTNTIINIEDIVYKQRPNLGEKFKISPDEYYVCIRDYRSSCIYINENQFEQFKKMTDIYNDECGIINLSYLIKCTKSRDIFAVVANKTVPEEVSIKEVKCCKVRNIDLFITRVIKLNNTDQLFKDLINIQILKDKYDLN